MKKFLKSYSLIIVFVIVSALIMVMVLYSRWLNEFFVEENEQNVRIRLSESAKRLAEMITAEELSMYMTEEDMRLPEYQALKMELVEFAEDADVVYAYYLRETDGKIQYIIDNDFDPETVVGLDTPPTETGEFMPIFLQALSGETAVSELGLQVPGWDGLLSAYSPVFDSGGNVAAIAGVDIYDQEIVDTRSRTRVLMTMELVAIIAVLAYGIYGFGKYRKEAVAAKSANDAKSRFLSLISHEVRTPMNAILGITEILLREENLSPEIEKGMEDIRDSGDLLLGIVNDILDMSKIEAGKMEISPLKYDIPALINGTVQLCRIRYEGKPIEFILEIGENTPLYLIGDELRIKQILNNLLSNAYKYTEKGSIKMTVGITEKDGSPSDDEVTLVISVSDTGAGMSAEQLGRLFTEYTRFNQEANRNTIGIGLGLSITKQLVEMMKGEITVESEVGKGSVFTVRLPQKRDGELVCGRELAEKLMTLRYHSTAFSKRGSILHEYMPYGSVLVVDDVISNLNVAKGLLIPYSLNVESAESGFEAIEMIKSGKVYDIIFMDHMMPKMDGVETVKVLREMGYNGSIIALTANALIGQADIFAENGFDGYVSKPIDSRELDFVLNEHIRDKKPPQVVEAARREFRNRVKQGDNEKMLDAEVMDSFILDAERAISTFYDLLAKIQWGDSDFTAYRIITHGIKNALYNIGEKELSRIAGKLEKEAANGDTARIKSETRDFAESMEALLSRLRGE